jgi:hypothetical protein
VCAEYIANPDALWQCDTEPVTVRDEQPITVLKPIAIGLGFAVDDAVQLAITVPHCKPARNPQPEFVAEWQPLRIAVAAAHADAELYSHTIAVSHWISATSGVRQQRYGRPQHCISPPL